MHDDELTNLLPLERQKKLRRRYFMRLLTVTLFVATLLVGISAALLVPTFVLLERSAAIGEERLARVREVGASSSEKDLSKQLATLTARASILTGLTTQKGVEALLGEVLALSRPGIVLTAFALTPSGGVKGAKGGFLVTGSASTRESLRSFQLALQGLSWVSTASLPVSAYAQASDIPFAITLVLKP